MSKRLYLLSGLSILAVVLNHAAGWGYTAMFWWTDSYRAVTVPNYDQMGSLPYYVLLVIKQLTVFGVPAFLFVSGFFVAYAARGSASSLSWKMVRNRIANLLVPYLIWSFVIFVGDALQGTTYSTVDYVLKLLVGAAVPTFFYVPLLCQFFLLAPFLVMQGKQTSRRLLWLAALTQLGMMCLMYWQIFRQPVPFLQFFVPADGGWFFPGLLFFFVLGIVAGLRAEVLKRWLANARVWLVGLLLIGMALVMVEPLLLSRLVGKEWHSNLFLLSSNIYSLAFILCFLAFSEVQVPYARGIYYLGGKTYGIYLLHLGVLEIVARTINHFVPGILAYQSLLQPILIVAGLGIPLLVMAAVAASPARRAYRYLFG